MRGNEPEGCRRPARARRPSLDGTVTARDIRTPLTGQQLPTMKDKPFEEEKEWRFIYVLEAGDPVNSKRLFRASDDGLLVPYYLLSDVLGWPQSPKPALPIKEIATGPSPHQELNIRSLQHLKLATVRDSLIPYRGR